MATPGRDSPLVPMTWHHPTQVPTHTPARCGPPWQTGYIVEWTLTRDCEPQQRPFPNPTRCSGTGWPTTSCVKVSLDRYRYIDGPARETNASAERMS